jgi:type IV pilus assembly protein PilC
MPLYRYVAATSSGAKQSGSVFAESESKLEELLSQQNLELVRAHAQSEAPSPARDVRRSVKTSPAELANFFFRLGIQLRAGVNLLDALGDVDEESGDKMPKISAALAESVRGGSPLSEGMAAFPRAFPDHVRMVVRVGEKSGRLAENCLELRGYIEWMEKNWKDFRQAMIYPAALAFALVAFIFVALRFIFPVIVNLLYELEVPLPLVTRMLISASDLVVAHWHTILAIAVLGPMAFRFLQKKSKAFATWTDGMLFQIPYLGEVVRAVCVARFLRNFILMLQAGVIITDSLDAGADVVGNRVLEKSIRRVGQAVANGTKMNEAMRFEPVFPQIVRQMMIVGEQTGSLDTSLREVVAYYDDIIPRRIKTFFSVLEPVLIVTGLLIAATIAAAVFLPLVSLLNVNAY